MIESGRSRRSCDRRQAVRRICKVSTATPQTPDQRIARSRTAGDARRLCQRAARPPEPALGSTGTITYGDSGQASRRRCRAADSGEAGGGEQARPSRRTSSSGACAPRSANATSRQQAERGRGGRAPPSPVQHQRSARWPGAQPVAARAIGGDMFDVGRQHNVVAVRGPALRPGIAPEVSTLKRTNG